jgi:hypothetical protein
MKRRASVPTVDLEVHAPAGGAGELVLDGGSRALTAGEIARFAL